MRQPGHRFVGDQELGLGRHGARQLELAHLDLRQVARQSLGLAGQADLAEVASALTILYGVETGIDLSRLTSLRRLGEDITRVYVARNKPITGDEVFNWGGLEIIVHELEVDPLLHWCIEPAVVGNEKRWIIDKTSGPWTMQTKLDELGIELDRDLVYDLLSAVKEEMDIHKRVLSDDELRELAERVREGAALATA